MVYLSVNAILLFVSSGRYVGFLRSGGVDNDDDDARASFCRQPIISLAPSPLTALDPSMACAALATKRRQELGISKISIFYRLPIPRKPKYYWSVRHPSHGGNRIRSAAVNRLLCLRGTLRSASLFIQPNRSKSNNKNSSSFHCKRCCCCCCCCKSHLS